MNSRRTRSLPLPLPLSRVLYPLTSLAALSGLALAGSNSGGAPPTDWARTPSPYVRVRPVPTSDRFVVVAPEGLDSRFVAAAPRGIDDRMIVGPGYEGVGVVMPDVWPVPPPLWPPPAPPLPFPGR